MILNCGNERFIMQTKALIKENLKLMVHS